MALRQATVLIAGMKTERNQFTRALSRYPNVTTYWVNPDPGPFPRDCDAVVMPIIQLSHAKYNAVKEAYKGKPVFVCREGFTEVKEKFERWLDQLPPVPNTEPLPVPAQTVMGHALHKALSAAASFGDNETTGPRDSETQTEQTNNTPVGEETVMSQRPRKPRKKVEFTIPWVKNYIWIQSHAGVSAPDIAKQLNRLGFRIRSGGKYKPSNIQTMRSYLKEIKFQADPELAKQPPPSGITVTATAPVAAPEAATRERKGDADEKALIGLILDSHVSKEKKLRAIEALL